MENSIRKTSILFTLKNIYEQTKSGFKKQNSVPDLTENNERGDLHL